jgi:predicted metal-dependent peptidase
MSRRDERRAAVEKSKRLSPEQKLSTARYMARRRFGYYGASFVKLVPVWVERGAVGTVGILPNYVMLVDPEPLDRWSVSELEGVLCHEVQHPIRGHAERGEKLARSLGLDHDAFFPLWNIATDMEINDDLVAAGVTLPDDGGILAEKFGLERGWTAEAYFRALLKEQQSCQQCGREGKGKQGKGDAAGEQNGKGTEEGDPGEQDQDAEGEGEGEGAGKGKAKGQAARSGKSGTGKGEGGQPGKDDAGGGPEASGSRSNGNCPACGKNAPQKPVAGGGWDGSGGGRPLPIEKTYAPQTDKVGRTPAEQRAIQRQVAEAVRAAAAKGRGDVPGGLVRWAEEFLKPPKVDWRTKLGEVCRTAVKYRAGATTYTYSRPCRRQAVYGFGPGRPILPDMVQPVPRVAIAVDTSGSMSPRELADAVCEADGILKAIGASATFIACDATVGALREVRTRREVLAALVGGGGTDFRPVFEAVEKLRPRPEVVVFATDGQGPAPARPPAGVKTVWLLVGRGAQKPWFPTGTQPWGEFVEIKSDDVEGASA